MDIATRIGPYATIMILGDPGSGKSRMAAHLIQLLNLSDAPVVTVTDTSTELVEAPFVIVEDSARSLDHESLRWPATQLCYTNRYLKMTVIYIAQHLHDLYPIIWGNTDIVFLMGGTYSDSWLKQPFAYLRDYFGSYEEFCAAIPEEPFKALIVDRRRRGGFAELHTMVYSAPPPN